MKKTISILVALLLFGCSNNEKLLIINDTTPIPLKTQKGDNYIFLEELDHKVNAEYLKFSKENDKLKVIFKTKRDDVEKINLVVDGLKIPMKSIGGQGRLEYFSVEISLEEGKEIKYYFELLDHEYRYYYGKESSNYESTIIPFEYTVKEESRMLPEWVQGEVWYSIYIDSFRDGSKENTPIYSEYGPEYYFRPNGSLSDGTLKSELIDPTRWRKKGDLQSFEMTGWGSDWNKLSYTEIDIKNRYFPSAGKNSRRYGGDLQGIEEKLDYLKELGVGVINLSPVFYSNSGSKLNTIDYAHISPDFAITSKNSYRKLNKGLNSEVWTESDILFQKIVDKTHEKDMKIILDINFSYVSAEFFAYKDFLKNGITSKYKNWFIIKKSDSNIKTNNFVSKIDLNLSDKNLQDYLIKSTVKWAKGNNNIGIDGYFIKNDIENKEFLERWKSALLEVNSDFIIVGEDSKVNRDLYGINGFDMMGTYGLGSWLNKYLNSSEVITRDKKASEIMNSKDLNIPTISFIESYDTDRFYSRLINPNREFDRLNKYGKDDYINIRPNLVDPLSIKKLKLGVVILLTASKNPMIYYGSEKGMWGADVSENRKPMIWEDIIYENESDTLEKYIKNKKIIEKIFKTDEIKDEISYSVESEKSLEDLYKKVGVFRNNHKDLMKYGNLEVLNLEKKIYEDNGSISHLTENDVLAYKREYENEKIIVIINKSNLKKSINLPLEDGEYYNVLTEEVYKNSKTKVDIEGFGYIILKLSSQKS